MFILSVFFFFKWYFLGVIFLLLFVCLFVCLWLCWVFVSVRGLSLVVASGDHSSSRWAGLSLSRPLLAEHRLQTHRLSSCGSRAQLLRGTWDLPRPELEPVSPALAGRLSTTAPPGKPPSFFNTCASWWYWLRLYHLGSYFFLVHHMSLAHSTEYFESVLGILTVTNHIPDSSKVRRCWSHLPGYANNNSALVHTDDAISGVTLGHSDHRATNPPNPCRPRHFLTLCWLGNVEQKGGGEE